MERIFAARVFIRIPWTKRFHSLYIRYSFHKHREIPREEAEKSEEGREKLGEFHEFPVRNASRGKAGGESRPVAVLQLYSFVFSIRAGYKPPRREYFTKR